MRKGARREARLLKSYLPPRPRSSHKGRFGHVLVAAGSPGLTGAALLCACGAAKGGAGLVTLAVPRRLEPLVARRAPWEIMTLALPDAAPGRFCEKSIAPLRHFIEKKKITSVALGPGLSDHADVQKFVLGFLKSASAPLVIDADGLNVLARLRSFPKKHPPLVVTPHPGEAARLLGWTTRRVEADRKKAVAALCRKTGGVAVLKGGRTLVSDGRRIFENTTGNAGLARGGAGDILTGLVAAFIGQVAGESVREKLFRAACVAVYVHGAAADAAARRTTRLGLSIRDVLDAVPAAYRRIFGKTY